MAMIVELLRPLMYEFYFNGHILLVNQNNKTTLWTTFTSYFGLLIATLIPKFGPYDIYTKSAYLVYYVE